VARCGKMTAVRSLQPSRRTCRAPTTFPPLMRRLCPWLFLYFPALVLAVACTARRPGPNLSADVVTGPGCEFGIDGAPRVVGNGTLHRPGKYGVQRGHLGISCSTGAGRGYRSVTILFNVAAHAGTIPEGTYDIVRGGVGRSRGPVAEVVYYGPPYYLAADGGSVTIRRDAEGRMLVHLDAITIHTRRP